MIQRIQSVWLLVAAVLCAGLFCFDLYHAHALVNNADTLIQLRVNDRFPLLLYTLVLVALPLVTIFMFKDRKRQRGMAMFNIVAIIGFIATVLMYVTNIHNQNPAPTNATYWIGAVLPVIALVFIIMAMRAIRKDEKLVRSVDRLR